MPPRIDLELISDGDARARRTPPRIVGVSLEPDDIVIFCDRVLPYPYGSLESVFRHEVAHLALSSRARGQRLPRWLHEGVAMSVDRGWDTAGRLRLLLEMTGSPATADLARLFTSGMQPDAAQAYGLSAALVADIQRRHGAEAPGRIASRVASGIPFPQAFRLETGDTPEQAAQRAWRGYRRWTMWVSAATSEGAVWGRHRDPGAPRFRRAISPADEAAQAVGRRRAIGHLAGLTPPPAQRAPSFDSHQVSHGAPAI
jgi:hypothetical protein